MHSVKKVKAVEGRCLRLVFDDGTSGICDLSAFVNRGGIAAPLADAEFFAKVRRSRDGAFIKWPATDIELCAHSLWIETVAKPNRRSGGPRRNSAARASAA
jgi:hypothetical protein